MALRLAEVVVPASDAEALDEILDEQPVVDHWTYEVGDDLIAARILVATEDTESLTDLLADRFGKRDGFRTVLLAVEATLPRPQEQDDEAEVADDPGAADTTDEAAGRTPNRISREELYEDVSKAAALTPVYLVTVGLSTVVAAAGLIRGDVAVVIGAMVIAPLLGPNVGLSLAATLGDTDLALRSGKAIAAGVATAFGLSLAIGLFMTIDPGVPELFAKAKVNLADVAIALAAGSAGSLAFTSGLSSAIVGVMVAVALLPPLVATGLFLGSGSIGLASGAAILVATNVACLNLAAVATFLAQKVGPREWWEAEKAKKATRLAVGSWLLMVAVLVVVILLVGG